MAAFTGGTVERDAKGKLKAGTHGGTADLAIKVVNLVKLFKNGEPYKMSKRAGTFVTCAMWWTRSGATPSAS